MTGNDLTWFLFWISIPISIVIGIITGLTTGVVVSLVFLVLDQRRKLRESLDAIWLAANHAVVAIERSRASGVYDGAEASAKLTEVFETLTREKRTLDIAITPAQFARLQESLFAIYDMNLLYGRKKYDAMWLARKQSLAAAAEGGSPSWDSSEYREYARARGLEAQYDQWEEFQRQQKALESRIHRLLGYKLIEGDSAPLVQELEQSWSLRSLFKLKTRQSIALVSRSLTSGLAERRREMGERRQN